MSVPALERGIAILRLFRRDRRELTAPVIANELSLPRSTVHRLLAELVRLDLLRRVDESIYALDTGVLGLGFEYLASRDIVELSGAILEELRDSTGWSTHLAVREQRNIVYLARFASRAAVTRNIAVGSTLPAHATSIGRLLLSDLEPVALHKLYEGVELERISPETPGSLTDLQRLIQQDRERGYVVGCGFYERDVRAIAAPVRDARLGVVAAINATATDDSGLPDDAAVPLVLAAARRISQLLGAPETMPALPASAKEVSIWR